LKKAIVARALLGSPKPMRSERSAHRAAMFCIEASPVM
jgi:hypothetical protein